MIEYYLLYDVVTGDVRVRGAGSPGTAAAQQVPEGMAVLTVPYEAVSGAELNLEPIREALIGLANYNCGQFRLRFITSIPGQETAYGRKLEKARNWTSDANPDDFRSLVNEAHETGMSVADVVALVLQTAAHWATLDDEVIEPKRRGAMVKIAAATNVADMVRAASIDWDALVAPPAAIAAPAA